MQSRAIETSANLRKIDAQRKALTEEVREKKSEWMPELFVRMERQEYRGDGTAALGINNRIFFGFASRFGAGLSNFTAVESLEKRQESIRFEYETARRALSEVVQMDIEQLLALESRIPLLNSALESARQTLEAWDRQFLAGRRSWVDVMNAAREEAQAEIEVQDAQVAYESVRWRLTVYTTGLTVPGWSVSGAAR